MPSNEAPDPARRLNDVEVLLMHQQRDLSELNTVIIDQQRQIDLLKQELAQLSGRVLRTVRPPADDPVEDLES